MIRRLISSDVDLLFEFLSNELSDEDKELFHPHSFKKATLSAILQSNDIYIGYFDAKLIGYGMLRWHEGFDNPIVGIAVSKNHRRKGIAKQLIECLISTCPTDILKCKIFASNYKSLGVFRSMGFRFKAYEYIGVYDKKE